jgi:hypothetical protein
MPLDVIWRSWHLVIIPLNLTDRIHSLQVPRDNPIQEILSKKYLHLALISVDGAVHFSKNLTTAFL